jgi:predicted nucleotidyltransferase component of viral defense system
MDYKLIRKQIIISIFAVDELFETMVLKGGNALMAYGISTRTSKDIDFSIEDDWRENSEHYSQLIEKSLIKNFDDIGFYLFDYKFLKSPKIMSEDKEGFWGGYTVVFKLIDKKLKKEIEKKCTDQEKIIENLRKQAKNISQNDNSKKFHIDISKFEICNHKDLMIDENFNYIPIHIYSKAALVIEKLRAICQQSHYYQELLKVSRRPRARDFYDIYEIIEQSFQDTRKDSINFFSNNDISLIKEIFKIKKVPLELLKKIETDRNFHKSSANNLFEQIEVAIEHEEFDYYFDYVADLGKKLFKKIDQ